MIITAEQCAPCRVFDAHGTEWPDLKWIDNETGEGEQALRHEGGGFMYHITEGAICTLRVQLSTPIRIEPL